MDKLDYSILSEILKDGTFTFCQIANLLNTTPSTVRRRYEKMKREGIIANSVTSIDLSKLGYHGKVFLLINLCSDGDKSETISYLLKMRNVIVVTELIGPYNILAIAPVKDLKNVQDLVIEARKAPHVQKVEMEYIEDTFFPVSPNYGKVLSMKSNALKANL